MYAGSAGRLLWNKQQLEYTASTTPAVGKLHIPFS